MQKKFPLISIYDANSEKEILMNKDVISHAHALALALEKAKLGIIGRVGSPVISTILNTLAEKGGTVLGLSPAST